MNPLLRTSTRSPWKVCPFVNCPKSILNGFLAERMPADELPFSRTPTFSTRSPSISTSAENHSKGRLPSLS